MRFSNSKDPFGDDFDTQLNLGSVDTVALVTVSAYDKAKSANEIASATLATAKNYYARAVLEYTAAAATHIKAIAHIMEAKSNLHKAQVNRDATYLTLTAERVDAHSKK